MGQSVASGTSLCDVRTVADAAEVADETQSSFSADRIVVECGNEMTLALVAADY